MTGVRPIKGIGRLYSGKDFLGEVMYDLRIAESAIPGLMTIKGEIHCQKEIPGLNSQKLLRLDSGKMFEVMLLIGDALKGIYKCQGDEWTPKGNFLP